MPKVSHTNETKNFQHVGGVTIPPGETRDVEASLLPGYQPEGGAPAELPSDPLAKLMTGSVKFVTAELVNLSADDLDRALLLEQEGQNRKSMIEAITAETLRRLAQEPAKPAAAPTDADQTDGAQTGDEQTGDSQTDPAKQEA